MSGLGCRLTEDQSKTYRRPDMHQSRTPWPVPTRLACIVAFEELRHESPWYGAREFCRVAGVSYSAFSRWWAAWCRRRYECGHRAGRHKVGVKLGSAGLTHEQRVLGGHRHCVGHVAAAVHPGGGIVGDVGVRIVPLRAWGFRQDGDRGWRRGGRQGVVKGGLST